MRRFIVLCLSTVLLVMAAAPAHAGKPSRYSYEYRSASGSWVASEQVGRNATRTTYTYIAAYVSPEWSGADVWSESTICRTSGRNTTCEFEGWTYGWADGAAVSIATDLSTASVAGTFTLETWDGRRSTTSSAEVSASFTGVGAVQTNKGSWTYRSNCFSYRTTFSDSWRQATATGSIGGRDLGTAEYAGMYAGASRTMERTC